MCIRDRFLFVECGCPDCSGCLVFLFVYTDREYGLSLIHIYSDLEQAQREEVMYEFKTGRINILVATEMCIRDSCWTVWS